MAFEDLVYELKENFPIMIGNKEATDYIYTHFEFLERCLKENLFQDALFHLHLLYMSFVYFQIFRIKNYKSKDFRFGCIGFSNQKKELEEASSPFTFSAINERSVFRFFRLVDFDDSVIGSIAKCVEDRNELAHANGVLSLISEDEFLDVLGKYEQNFDNILRKQTDFLLKLYDDFSEVKQKNFEYSNTEDEIRENFIARNLISAKELSIILQRRTNSKHYKTLVKLYPALYEATARTGL